MDSDLKPHTLESVISVIENAHHIKRHVEFFTWLQTDVSKLIPHEILLSVWGDFKSQASEHHSLHYDLASGIKGVDTRAFMATTREVNRPRYSRHF